MAFTFIRSTVQGSPDTNGFDSTGIDTSTADLLIVGVSSYQPVTEPTFTDSIDGFSSTANTYTPLTVVENPTEARIHVYYAKNAVVGAVHKWRTAGNGSYNSIGIVAFNGSHLTAPLDQQNSATGNGITLASGSVTPSEGNELIVTFLGGYTNANANATVDGGFSAAVQNIVVAGQHYGMAISYLIQTSAATANPVWGNGGFALDSGSHAVTIATFKEAAGGGGPATHNTRAFPLGLKLGMKRRISG